MKEKVLNKKTKDTDPPVVEAVTVPLEEVTQGSISSHVPGVGTTSEGRSE